MSVRRVVIGVLLAALGFAAVAWPPGVHAARAAVATGCIYEFAGLSAKKGPAIELPVAVAAVWAYVILTHFGLIHRYEGILLAATVIVALGHRDVHAPSRATSRAAATRCSACCTSASC